VTEEEEQVDKQMMMMILGLYDLVITHFKSVTYTSPFAVLKQQVPHYIITE
jgi:hypothetical protein